MTVSPWRSNQYNCAGVWVPLVSVGDADATVPWTVPIDQGNQPPRQPPDTTAVAPGIPGLYPGEPSAPPKEDELHRDAVSVAPAAIVPPSRNDTGAAGNARDPGESRPSDYPGQRPTAPSLAADSRCYT